MRSLVPTSLRLLQEADAAFDAGWHSRARSLYEQVVEQAQVAADRATEAAGHAMLCRCLLRRSDTAAAVDSLERARSLGVDSGPVAARIHAAAVRLSARSAAGVELREALDAYLQWATAAGDDAAAFDACMLLSDHTTGDDRIAWTRRAIDHGQAAGLQVKLGGTYHALAAALEATGDLDEALASYQSALELNERLGDRRQVVASSWAVGAIAARLEDWPLAQEMLERAVDVASDAMDCEDLLVLALADLATAHQQYGDDIEARRHLLRALAVGREIAMAQRWPDRWDAMLAHAERLELV